MAAKDMTPATPYGLLGRTLGHSFSPMIHASLGSAPYALIEREPDDVAHFIREGDWHGINVTIPYKRLAAELADEVSERVRRLGVANTLVRRPDSTIFADNTDGKGCVSYLQRCGVRFDGARVAVCGTGPTSLAIMHACVQAGCAQAALLGRSAEKAQHALAFYRDRAAAAQSGVELSAGSYGEAAEALAGATLIVDATPLGMKPGDPAPFDTSLLAAGQVVFDAVYGHGETALVAAARAAGCWGIG